MADLGRLVAGRDCGTCTVCCVWLTIDDTDLRKAQGLRCPKLTSCEGCGIYSTRPHTCREFFCGFRRLDWVHESLRPDLSDVLINLRYDAPPSDAGRRLGVSFFLLSRASLEVAKLAETVAAAVNADLPVWLQIPGPPGYTAASARIDELLLEPARAGDLATISRILRLAYEMGSEGDFEPIALGDDQ